MKKRRIAVLILLMAILAAFAVPVIAHPDTPCGTFRHEYTWRGIDAFLVIGYCAGDLNYTLGACDGPEHCIKRHWPETQ